jgi:rhodanese-related sulfurtransferase
MRSCLIAVAVASLLLLGASSAAPPDFPVSYISVDELKGLVDRKQPAVIVDVRTRPEYDALHIAGARSIPLRSVRERAGQIPRTGLVVLY